MTSLNNQNKVLGDRFTKEKPKYLQKPKSHDAQDGLRQTKEVKKEQPKGTTKEDYQEASKNRAYIEKGLEYLYKRIGSIKRKSEKLENTREILITKKLLEYMEGLKEELLERKEEANDILKREGAQLASAVTLNEEERCQVKDIVRDYIKTRFQDAEKYVDNRIAKKENGGHASLTTKNTSPKETQNTTPTSEGGEPIPKPRNSINSNNSDTSLKNAPQTSFDEMKSKPNYRTQLAQDKYEERKPRLPRTSLLELKVEDATKRTK